MGDLRSNMKPFVELISTGSELLNGRTATTHARALGDAVGLLGLRLVRDTTVPDDAVAITDALRDAMKRVDIVMVSGGLGPTSDDLTREIVGSLLDRAIVMHEPSREAIRARFRRTGRTMTESVERHALVLEGAEVLANPAGLAPGERIEVGEKIVFLLPGPPREFNAILAAHVVPWLKERFGHLYAPLVQLFEVCGLGESEVVTKLVPQGFPGEDVEVSYCAMPGRVEIRLSAGREHKEALHQAAHLARHTLGPAIFAEERIELEDVVGRLLRDMKATLATAESCTGGLIGHRITSIAGSSEYYLGGVVSYSNASKVRDLGVREDVLHQHGAVSQAVAEEMAVGVRQRFGSTLGLAVTGIMGPSGGTPDKPVGLVYVAVSEESVTAVKEFRLAGDRTVIKEWTAQVSLDFLRRRLLGALDG